MRKFWAVVKHEYKKIVGNRAFLVGTLLFPVIGAGFAVVPALIFSIKGEPIRLAIADRTGKIASRVQANILAGKDKEQAKSVRDALGNELSKTRNEKIEQSSEQFSSGFIFQDYDSAGKTDEQIRRELNAKIIDKELDAFLIIPQNFAETDAKYEFYSRKAGDFSAERVLRDALNKAVRSQRLADAQISEDKLISLSRNVDFESKGVDERGEEKDADSAFIAAFVIGLMIYLLLTIYGQQILAAVVEEKETRIAEILFSSAKPFELMLGKLVGVCLAGLTQLSIWIFSAVILLGIGAANLGASGIDVSLPYISPLMILCFLIFFLLGFFVYATIYALIGSVVTTAQEGSQFAFPPMMLLLVGFYLSFAIVRDPNSGLSFWASIAPFFAPITMPVRILAETPPAWQIILAIVLNLIVIAGLVWLASRVYRIGMLMYGKRATIPEIMKWIRQS